MMLRTVPRRLLHGVRDQKLVKNAFYIDGQWVQAHSGQTVDIVNPSTRKAVAHVPDGNAADARKAVDAASRAFKTWSVTTGHERSKILRRWYDLINSNSEDLARIMTIEQGKPLAEARGEIAYGSSFVDWFSGEAMRTNGLTIPSPTRGRQIVVMRQPVGVAAMITPWNFPNAMITRKACAALAAGCTVVLRPAEATPLSALALAELGERAGIPPGVFNIVTSHRHHAQEIGQQWCEDFRVRKISFTGSTAVGKQLMAQSAATVKRVSMELGGNAPFIIYDDADLDVVMKGIAACKYRNAGQTCISANRIYVQNHIAPALIERLSKHTASLTVGDGLEPGVVIGPLINEAAVKKVHGHVEDAKKKGAVVTVGGRTHPTLAGNFYLPTVLTNCNTSMDVAEDETFGPVCSVFTFKSEEDAVEAANNTKAGLAAYIFTKDLGRAWRTSEKLEYGMVVVNSGVVGSEVAPFGGVKESGIGREGSVLGMDDYLDYKTLHMQHTQ